MSQPAHTFDALVVGSGMTGGIAAKELTERGLKTLVLERGRPVEHVKDYPTALLHPWQLPNHNRVSQQVKTDAPIQSTLYLYGEDTRHFFVKDVDHPYVQEQPFAWFRGYHAGGRSLMWSRHVFRYSDLDFGANAKEGVGTDWPIRYADLASWYDHVERFIGASGENSGLPQLPEQILQPPFEMNAFEKHIRHSMERRFTDRRLIASATAVLTQAHNGRGACQARNQCARGCPYGAYYSSNSGALPVAAATGNLTFRTGAIVHSLIHDENTGAARGVRVIDAETKATTEYFAKVIFLCASTLNSTAILLNSVSRRFPAGFGNDSGVLGHYLMDHHNGGGASGVFTGLLDRYYRGRRSTSVYVPRFRNVGRREAKFARGYGYEVYTGRATWTRGVDGPGFGAEFKKEITRPGPWTVFMEGYGECLPYRDNRVWIDRGKLDRWGMPTLHVSASYRENERAMAEQMKDDAVEILEAAGVESVKGFNHPVRFGSVIHEMGTARMGHDPSTSVLNRFNQVHAAPNVFVTDGSCMVSSPTQNPSLTYMALTARAVNHAVGQLKSGELKG